MIGEVLGGYKVVSKLGEGATGETYLAEHQETGQKAAAKVLFPPMSADRALLDRFFAEVRASSQVNHVGIADLFACGVHANGRAFLVMELLEGKTLTDSLVELGSVSDMESFADIGWQLATLLAATHASKIVHGALKPDGIFLTFPPAQAPRPLVKLLDFGMARFSLSVRHSQTGSLLGAPLYTSPESSRGLGNVDHRADIYSLGCILFEMACGRPPFVREGKGELIIAHATETPPSVASLEPAIPQAIDRLIGRMLTKNPATRPQTMSEVAAVLEKFFKCPAPSLGQPIPPKPVVIPAPPVVPARLTPASAIPGPPIAAAIRTPEPAPDPKPSPRRQDPTALLPPGATFLPQAGPTRTPTAPPAWVARVHERTAILDPPSAPRPPLVPPSRKPKAPLPEPGVVPHPRRASVPARSENPRPTLPISLPIVIASAALVLAVGAAILVLRTRRPPPTAAPRAPLVLPKERAVSDEAGLAQPAPSYPSHPMAPPPVPDDSSGAEKRQPQARAKGSAAAKPKPDKKLSASRW